ncbi:MAG: hypothetical protein WCK91_02180, partial [bacterium]
MNITSSSANHATGDSFSAYVVASSTDQALNAVDGVVSFPIDKLEVTSVSKDDSVLSLWTQEPTFSNNTGSVNFSGVALNPGYAGSSGKIIKINFKAKKSGSAAVVFSSGSVLANDGLGTNILTGLNSKQFNLSDGTPTKTSVEPTVTVVKKPVVVQAKKEPQTVAVTQTPPPSPEESHIIVKTEKVYEPLISPEIIRVIKSVITYGSIFALLLLLLCLMYFAVIYIWHRVVVLHIRLKSETSEVSRNVYKSLKSKVDKSFADGDYLSALSGYRKLQEQASSSSQPELNDKIILSTKLLVSKENFKRAQVAAGHSKWLEAKVLLEEGDCVTDPMFTYYNEAKRLHDEARMRIADIGAESSSLQVTIQKKLIETEHTLEKAKSDIIYNQGLFMSEKSKREQAEEEGKRLGGLIKEKDSEIQSTISNFESKLRDKDSQIDMLDRRMESRLKEKSSDIEVIQRGFESKLKDKAAEFERVIDGYKLDIREKDARIAEVDRMLEEAKASSVEQRSLLIVEQAKTSQKEEQVKDLSAALDDKAAEFERVIDGYKLDIKEKDARIAEVDRMLEEAKA